MDIPALLDSEIAAAIAQFPGLVVDDETLPLMRTPYPALPLSERVVRTDHTVPGGRPGDPPVKVRVHRPVGVEGALPCIYVMHGGGYLFGSYDLDDALLDRWCPLLGVVGVSVEYRLAPEHPYPAPLDDCYAGLRWVHDRADELGVDPSKIGVYGISAGGGLAAALALLARDRGEVPLAFQMLDSPMIDDRQQTASSQLDGLPVWKRESNTYAWRSYLGELYGSDDIPIYAAAARTTDLSGLPPSFVSVGALDGFRDEDIDYAQRLNVAGVPCELHVYPGAPHGYQMAMGARIVRQGSRDRDNWLIHQLSLLAAAAPS